MKYTSAVFTCDKPNANGRVYPKTLAMKMVEEFKKGNPMFGRIGMPEEGRLMLSDVSHSVVDMNVEGANLVVEVEILDTPKGKVIKDMLEHFPEEYVLRTAGSGTTFKDKDGVTIIGDDFKLESVNFVLKKDAA